MDCPCVKRHSPEPAYLQIHHILPKSWGGKDTSDNKIALCGTTHDSVHHLLNKMVRLAHFSGVSKFTREHTRGYTRLAIKLAYRAWAQYLEQTNGTFPTKLTTGRPENPG